MKTTGLLALMAHAGLPVPVTEAVFPFFDDVLADIGDSQSIQESLSSFSGHLIHVKQMMEAVTPNSLVLMDELGRATDPEEGGALGVAILDRFRQTGAFCLASTHLLPLKLYGTKTAGVVNASMGFDEATLQPTYQLRVGLPGKSAGLDIASRLELPADVIAHARSVLPKLEADFQSLLVELHRQIEEHAEQQRQLARATADLEQQKATVEREAIQREEKRRQQWLRQTEELVARFDEQARTTIDKVVHAGDQRKAAEQASRLIAKAKREFREEASEALQPPAGQPAPPPLPVLKEGARVRLKDVREPATVRRHPQERLAGGGSGFPEDADLYGRHRGSSFRSRAGESSKERLLTVRPQLGCVIPRTQPHRPASGRSAGTRRQVSRFRRHGVSESSANYPRTRNGSSEESGGGVPAKESTRRHFLCSHPGRGRFRGDDR